MTADLAESCAAIAAWLPVAAALITEPDADGTTKTIEFTGRPRRPCNRPRGMSTPGERCSMDDATREAWRPVAGFEGLYEVSDLGRVRSLPRETENGHRRRAVRKGRVLAPRIRRRYLAVTLTRSGDHLTVSVHGLVAAAFIGPCPPGQQVRHGPSGKLDNRAANLSYGTPAENAADKVRDGIVTHFSPSGEINGNAKLSWAIVAECRSRRAAGATIAALAREHQVDASTMSVALAGLTWRQP